MATTRCERPKRAATSNRQRREDFVYYGEFSDFSEEEEPAARITGRKRLQLLINEDSIEEAADRGREKRIRTTFQLCSSSSSRSAADADADADAEIATSPPAVSSTIDKEAAPPISGRSCHQCKRKGKNTVIDCSKCGRKGYCIACIDRWYPQMSKDLFRDACPCCRGNCNCIDCLRKCRRSKNALTMSDTEKIKYASYVLYFLLPPLKKLNQEQVKEKEIEAEILGLPLSELEVRKAFCHKAERVFCDHCRTSIVDLHRSCPNCSYELCIRCCQEMRESSHKGCCEELVFCYSNRGNDYMHGGGPLFESFHQNDTSLPVPLTQHDEWVVNSDGSISCPLAAVGGCGASNLELKRMFPENWISVLEVEAQEVASSFQFLERPDMATHMKCDCLSLTCKNSRKAASREKSADNYLYCPHSTDIKQNYIDHFQKHWINGEPVIVRGVHENTSGLSWEPMVMWRAIRSNKTDSRSHQVKAIDSLSCCEELVL